MNLKDLTFSRFILLASSFSLSLLVGLISVSSVSHAQTSSPTRSNYIQLSQGKKVGENDCAYRNLTKAYSTIGFQVDFLVLPAKRALIESNRGTTDGETARIKNIDQKYPNLIRVPVAICHMQQNLYRLAANQHLAHTPLENLQLGILNGGVYVEREFNKYKHISAMNNKQLLNLLLKGRVDAIVMGEGTLKMVLKKAKAPAIVKIDIFIPNVPLFHYLHKKHAALVPKITKALQQLEQSGFIADTIKNHQP